MAESRPEKGGADAPVPLKKWRKTDDLEQLRVRVHRALRASEEVMYAAAEEGHRQGVLNAARATHQIARTYMKVLAAGDLEERVAALEQAQESSAGSMFAHLQKELTN